jgi:hypothetical protein
MGAKCRICKMSCGQNVTVVYVFSQWSECSVDVSVGQILTWSVHGWT